MSETTVIDGDSRDEIDKEKKHSAKRQRVKLRKQVEIERDQRRQEKEESEQKKKRSLQKQASFMERFLHKNKKAMVSQNAQSENDAIPSIRLSRREKMHESVTISMDSALSQKEQIDIEEVRKSHLNSWHHLGNPIRSRSGQHWGLRRKPKIALVKDLKLSSGNGTKQEEELNTDSMVGGWGEPPLDDQACNSNINFTIQKCRRSKQLLQFDKSYRPAFYGVWPKKSNIVGPRNPYKKDPELDYDVDSDEEWEEEEPGESLSECDKDEEENFEEGLLKGEDGDESEDGFLVPDGYLSESEGVQSDGSPCRIEEDETGTSLRSEPEAESEEFSSWVRQLKHLYKLTEHALSKNQPLIITNMKHERNNMLYSDNLTGSSKVKHICMQALAMRSFPNGFVVEIHSDGVLIREDQEAFIYTSKSKSLVAGRVKGIPDSELPKIVATIESCPYCMKKVLEILLQKFPNCSKSLLRNKVRQISDFVDNKWQVKKEVLDQLGLSNSPGACCPLTLVLFRSNPLPNPPTRQHAHKNSNPQRSTQIKCQDDTCSLKTNSDL
ncbi:hypothetical protein V2J09_023683 [Rumex salicifolius]